MEEKKIFTTYDESHPTLRLLSDATRKKYRITGPLPEHHFFIEEVDREHLIVRPADGRKTIAHAKEVFEYGIDTEFKTHEFNFHSRPTPAIETDVYETKGDVLLSEVFSLVDEDLNRLTLTQGQIIDFCTNIDYNGKIRIWLRDKGMGTLFLTAGKSGDLHFVHVLKSEIAPEVIKLAVRVFPFDYPFLIRGICRRYLVVPRYLSNPLVRK